jgi:hypothetical protein
MGSFSMSSGVRSGLFSQDWPLQWLQTAEQLSPAFLQPQLLVQPFLQLQEIMFSRS